MYEFKEIRRLTRFGCAMLWVYAALALLNGMLAAYAGLASGGPDAEAARNVQAVAAVGLVAALVLTAIVVGIWIYRANENAQVIGGGLTVTPGWAVGWYFMPIMSLFKPYQGMKETWLASHYGSNWDNREATDLLNWWWGLWLGRVLFGSITGFTETGPSALAMGCNLVGGAVAAGAGIAMIRLMKQISEAQRATRHAEVFA